MDVQYDHVSLTVMDVDRSIAFYEKHFGLKCVRRDRPVAGDPVDLFSGIVGGEVIAAFLTNGQFILEFIEYTKRKSDALVAPANHVGSPHIAFVVPSVREAYKTLSADGVNFVGPPMHNTRRDTYNVTLRDPDGILIELRESSALAPAPNGTPFNTH